ncbi:hypothetical protein [Vibrio coralliirubri]|nr:hypothetical protein [Vibrio coralliirubri]
MNGRVDLLGNLGAKLKSTQPKDEEFNIHTDETYPFHYTNMPVSLR